MQPSQRDQNFITIQTPLPPPTKYQIQNSAQLWNFVLRCLFLYPTVHHLNISFSHLRKTKHDLGSLAILHSPLPHRNKMCHYLFSSSPLMLLFSCFSLRSVKQNLISKGSALCAQYPALKMINSTLVGQTLPFFFTGTALAYFHLGNIKGRQFVEAPEWGRPRQGQVNDQMGDVTETRKV